MLTNAWLYARDRIGTGQKKSIREPLKQTIILLSLGCRDFRGITGSLFYLNADIR
jgi:hypothetical protein